MNSFKVIEDPKDVCFKCLKKTKVNEIHIAPLGYLSNFDNFGTQINLCDECIATTNPEWWELEIIDDGEYGGYYKYEKEILNFVKNLPLAGQELFYARFAYGANADYISGQDWIDYKLGVLSHDKCKKYGLYSPDEYRAYEDQFSTCQHVVNIIYEDGSKASRCPFRASGKYGQIPSENISTECYMCKYYAKRKIPIKDIQHEDWNDYRLYYIFKLKEKKLKEKFENK